MELMLETPEELVDETKNAVEKYMRLAAQLGGFPVGADAGVGLNWNEVH